MIYKSQTKAVDKLVSWRGEFSEVFVEKTHSCQQHSGIFPQWALTVRGTRLVNFPQQGNSPLIRRQ